MFNTCSICNMQCDDMWCIVMYCDVWYIIFRSLYPKAGCIPKPRVRSCMSWKNCFWDFIDAWIPMIVDSRCRLEETGEEWGMRKREERCNGDVKTSFPGFVLNGDFLNLWQCEESVSDGKVWVTRWQPKNVKRDSILNQMAWIYTNTIG